MKNIKRVFVSFLLLCLLALFSPPEAAAQTGVKTWSGPGVFTGATNSWVVVPSTIAGEPRIEFLQAASDKTTSFLTFYTNGLTLGITAAIAAAQTNIGGTAGQIVSNLNPGFTNGDVIVLYRSSANRGERYSVYSSTATNFVVDSPITNALTANDLVLKMTANGRMSWGPLTNTINAAGGGIYNGVKGKPILVQIDSGTNGGINVISVRAAE